MDCHRARNERRCHWPAAHGIEAPTKSSSAPARPKRRRARRRDERYHYQHELADVRQRRRAKDHIHSIPMRPPSGAVRGHFLLAQPSLRSAALVVLSLMHRWRERWDGKTKRLARSRLAVCSRPRASTTLKTRETSARGAIRRAPRSGRDKVQSDSTLAVVRSAFPSRRFLTSKKAERPILKGFLD
jgi:hypothetical protein